MSDFAPYLDLLTGAWNKERFESELARRVVAAQRAAAPLALLRIDIDNLEEHNELHGKASLDQAISWLAAKVAEVVDGQGPIGRVGGDDFAVLLACPLDAALRIAERLRRLVPRTLHSSAFGDYRLTVSVGVAMLRRGEPWGNLFDAAERACLNAKQGGRDMVALR